MCVENIQQLVPDRLIRTHAQLERDARSGQKADLSRVKPLRKFVHIIRRYQDAVLAFIDTRGTNAIAEGINRILNIARIWPVACAITIRIPTCSS